MSPWKANKIPVVQCVSTVRTVAEMYTGLIFLLLCSSTSLSLAALTSRSITNIGDTADPEKQPIVRTRTTDTLLQLPNLNSEMETRILPDFERSSSRLPGLPETESEITSTTHARRHNLSKTNKIQNRGDHRRRDRRPHNNAASIGQNLDGTINLNPPNVGWNAPGAIASPSHQLQPQPDRIHDQLNQGEVAPAIIPLCPNCGLREETSDPLPPLTTDEITQIRIEAVKQQILSKLRLSRPPKVNVSDLHIPQPIYEGKIPDIYDPQSVNGVGSLDHHHGGTIHGQQGEEHYSGKTRIIIQAKTGDTPCWTESGGGKCFTFQFSSHNTEDNIQSAKLWVFWNGTVFTNLSTTQNISLSVKIQPTRHNDFTRTIRTDDFTNIGMVGWVTFDMKHNVRRWRKHKLTEHNIQVTCHNCAGEDDHVRLALSSNVQSGYTPFIVMHTSKSKRRSRVRRNSDCTYPDSSTCCKESLYILFEDINWDWIIMPKGFQANFCRGTCHLSTHLQSSNAGFMAAVYSERNREMQRRGIEFQTCCSPRSMSPLDMLYMDENKSFHRVQVPDISIQSCGCPF